MVDVTVIIINVKLRVFYYWYWYLMSKGLCIQRYILFAFYLMATLVLR